MEYKIDVLCNELRRRYNSLMQKGISDYKEFFQNLKVLSVDLYLFDNIRHDEELLYYAPVIMFLTENDCLKLCEDIDGDYDISDYSCELPDYLTYNDDFFFSNTDAIVARMLYYIQGFFITYGFECGCVSYTGRIHKDGSSWSGRVIDNSRVYRAEYIYFNECTLGGKDYGSGLIDNNLADTVMLTISKGLILKYYLGKYTKGSLTPSNLQKNKFASDMIYSYILYIYEVLGIKDLASDDNKDMVKPYVNSRRSEDIPSVSNFYNSDAPLQDAFKGRYLGLIGSAGCNSSFCCTLSRHLRDRYNLNISFTNLEILEKLSSVTTEDLGEIYGIPFGELLDRYKRYMAAGVTLDVVPGVIDLSLGTSYNGVIFILDTNVRYASYKDGGKEKEVYKKSGVFADSLLENIQKDYVSAVVLLTLADRNDTFKIYGTDKDIEELQNVLASKLFYGKPEYISLCTAETYEAGGNSLLLDEMLLGEEGANEGFSGKLKVYEKQSASWAVSGVDTLLKEVGGTLKQIRLRSQESITYKGGAFRYFSHWRSKDRETLLQPKYKLPYQFADTEELDCPIEFLLRDMDNNYYILNYSCLYRLDFLEDLGSGMEKGFVFDLGAGDFYKKVYDVIEKCARHRFAGYHSSQDTTTDKVRIAPNGNLVYHIGDTWFEVRMPRLNIEVKPSACVGYKPLNINEITIDNLPDLFDSYVDIRGEMFRLYNTIIKSTVPIPFEMNFEPW